MSHADIQAEHRKVMNDLAAGVDEIFNGDAKGADKKVAFVILVANFGQIDSGRVNYISNANREDIVCMMKETIGWFEGRVVEGGAVQ